MDSIQMTEEEKKIMDFEEAFAGFSQNDMVMIWEVNADGERVQLASLKNVPAGSVEELFDLIRKRFMKRKPFGKFFIQLRVAGKGFSRGFQINISNPDFEDEPKPEKPSGSSDLERLMVMMNQQFQAMMQSMANQEANEEKLLTKMKTMKEILGSGGSGGDPEKVLSMVMTGWKKGFELAQGMAPGQNQPSQSDQLLGSLLPVLVSKMGSSSAPQVVRRAVQATNPNPAEKKENEMNEAIARKLYGKYFTLLDLVKETAATPPGEEKESKTDSIVSYIYDFVPELAGKFLEAGSADKVILQLGNDFKITLNDAEKETVKKVYALLMESFEGASHDA